MRATVLSIRNFIIRLMFAAIAPFIGWLNDMYSLQVALLVSAGSYCCREGYFWGFSLERNKLKRENPNIQNRFRDFIVMTTVIVEINCAPHAGKRLFQDQKAGFQSYS